MADKQLGVRIPEATMEQLEQRVKYINEMTPEATVTVSSVVRYAIQQYTDGLQRKKVEPALTIPFIDDVAEAELAAFDPALTYEYYTDEELEQLATGIALITKVLKNKSSIPMQHVLPWESLQARVASTKEHASVLSQMKEILQSNYDESNLEEDFADEQCAHDVLFFHCPKCDRVNDVTYAVDANEDVYCKRCDELFRVASIDGNTLSVQFEWTDENEKWESNQKGSKLTLTDREFYRMTEEQYEFATGDEQAHYNQCGGCGNYYAKHRGIVRYDAENKCYICKQCRLMVAQY